MITLIILLYLYEMHLFVIKLHVLNEFCIQKIQGISKVAQVLVSLITIYLNFGACQCL